MGLIPLLLFYLLHLILKRDHSLDLPISAQLVFIIPLLQVTIFTALLPKILVFTFFIEEFPMVTPFLFDIKTSLSFTTLLIQANAWIP